MPDDREQRFGGVSRLYGTPVADAFSRSHVLVIGLGGVGSWTVEALARSGIGRLTLVDLDEVCLTNINRQLPALSDTVGRLKAEVLKERVMAIHPACEVVVEPLFYTESTSDHLLGCGCDLVVDAIDSHFQKCHLLASCCERGLPVVTCGSGGGRTDPTAIRRADLSGSYNDRLLMTVRKQLRGHYQFPRQKGKKFGIPCVFSEERPRPLPADASSESVRLNCDGGIGSIVTVTAALGFALAAEALRVLQVPREAADSQD